MGKVHGFEELWRKAMRNLQEINSDPPALTGTFLQGVSAPSPPVGPT